MSFVKLPNCDFCEVMQIGTFVKIQNWDFFKVTKIVTCEVTKLDFCEVTKLGLLWSYQIGLLWSYQIGLLWSYQIIIIITKLLLPNCHIQKFVGRFNLVTQVRNQDICYLLLCYLLLCYYFIRKHPIFYISVNSKKFVSVKYSLYN